MTSAAGVMGTHKGMRTNYLNVLNYIQTTLEENIIWVSSENTEASDIFKDLQKGRCKADLAFKHHILKRHGGLGDKAQHILTLH
jgi:hypothetical protein